MKLLTFGFLMFVFFSVFANCAPDFELMVSLMDDQPGRVVLGSYSNTTGPWNEKVYRARNENNVWVDIHEFILSGDNFQFQEDYDYGFFPYAQEDCVPAGEWTYIVPYECWNTGSCGCRNYESIKVPSYTSDCVNTATVSTITSYEFEGKKDIEVYEPRDDYNEPVADADMAENDQSDIDNSETVDIDDVDININDNDVSNTNKSGKSSGCSILVF